MSKIYEFSKESVERANAAHLLGFDVIGRSLVQLPGGKYSTTEVYMANVKGKAYLNPEWFPEIKEDEEVAVTYIMHWEDCNRLYRKYNSEAQTEKETNQEILNMLSKQHCIWIRDVLSKQPLYTDGMPWPMANMMGIHLPMIEFIGCFNEELSQQAFEKAKEMNIYLHDTLLKDYFKPGEEGFHFEVNDEILCNRAKFEECLAKLYHKFPHLKEYNEGRQ